MESRLQKNVDDLLIFLDQYNLKATFFTIGWIAEKYPEVIRKVAEKGHEIANAGYWGWNFLELSPDEFKKDIRLSRQIIEEAGSNKIVGFRSISHSLTNKDLWVLKVLADEGYAYDSSYLPSLFHVNMYKNERFMRTYTFDDKTITEIPLTTYRFGFFNLPIGGGNYFRQIPYSIMKNLYNRWCQETRSPFNLYMHPWELDETLPDITAFKKLSKIRQSRNLGKMKYVLPRYFKEGSFSSISSLLNINLEYSDSGKASGHPQEQRQKTATHALKPATVIIPCYNEQTSLNYLYNNIIELENLAASSYKLQFLFVDDCSTDETLKILYELFGPRKNCNIIKHTTNKGVAGAIRTGIEAATTDIVCSMDADCSYDPLELVKMIELLDGKTAMITASPYHPEGSVFAVPGWRLFLSKSLSRMYHLFMRNKLYTYTSCFRVYNREAALKNLNKFNDFRGIVEILARMDISGYTIKEYPTTLQSRIFGYSKMKTLKTIFYHLKLLREVWALKKKQQTNHQG
jgi:polysaccharide deacetylase family protein (PEP-CTERM system associated)